MPRKSNESEIRRTLHIVTGSDSFGYVEAYKVLRTNLIYAADAAGDHCRVILIASSIPAEGKSNLSVNLAVTLAQAGKRVVLLDCDLRKGTLHRYLRASRQLIGLTDILQENASLQDSIHHFKDLNIDVIFAGAAPDNPSELVGSPKMGKLLGVLSSQYDFVLCDTPPVGVVSDALALGRYADGAVLVVSFDKVQRQSALSSKTKLENSSIPILGTVLNMYDAKQARSTGNNSYGYYDYYSYGNYGYGKKTTSHSSKGASYGKSGKMTANENTVHSPEKSRPIDNETSKIYSSDTRSSSAGDGNSAVKRQTGRSRSSESIRTSGGTRRAGTK